MEKDIVNDVAIWTSTYILAVTSTYFSLNSFTLHNEQLILSPELML